MPLLKFAPRLVADTVRAFVPTTELLVSVDPRQSMDGFSLANVHLQTLLGDLQVLIAPRRTRLLLRFATGDGTMVTLIMCHGDAARRVLRVTCIAGGRRATVEVGLQTPAGEVVRALAATRQLSALAAAADVAVDGQAALSRVEFMRQLMLRLWMRMYGP